VTKGTAYLLPFSWLIFPAVLHTATVYVWVTPGEYYEIFDLVIVMFHYVFFERDSE
jgi:hypothetical protein